MNPSEIKITENLKLLMDNLDWMFGFKKYNVCILVVFYRNGSKQKQQTSLMHACNGEKEILSNVNYKKKDTCVLYLITIFF